MTNRFQGFATNRTILNLFSPLLASSEFKSTPEYQIEQLFRCGYRVSIHGAYPSIGAWVSLPAFKNGTQSTFCNEGLIIAHAYEGAGAVLYPLSQMVQATVGVEEFWVQADVQMLLGSQIYELIQIAREIHPCGAANTDRMHKAPWWKVHNRTLVRQESISIPAPHNFHLDHHFKRKWWI